MKKHQFTETEEEKRSREDMVAWVNSNVFVDKNGKTVEPEMKPDPTYDPETDDDIEPNYDRWMDSDDSQIDFTPIDLEAERIEREIGDAEERPKPKESNDEII